MKYNFPRIITFEMNNKSYLIERKKDNSISVLENKNEIPKGTTLKFLRDVMSYFKFEIEVAKQRKTNFNTQQLGRYVMKAIEERKIK